MAPSRPPPLPRVPAQRPPGPAAPGRRGPEPCSARLGTSTAGGGTLRPPGRQGRVARWQEAVAAALRVLARAGGCGSPLGAGTVPARSRASRRLPGTWWQGPARQPRFVLISAVSGAVTLN